MSRNSKKRGKQPGQFYRKPGDPPSFGQRRALYAISKGAESKGLTDWVTLIGNPYNPELTFAGAQELLNAWGEAFPGETKAYRQQRGAVLAAMNGRPTSPPTSQHGGVVVFQGIGKADPMALLVEAAKHIRAETKQQMASYQETHAALSARDAQMEKVVGILAEEPTVSEAPVS